MRSAQVTPGGARARWVEVPGGLQRPRVYLHGFGASSCPYFAAIAVHPAVAGSRSLLINMLGFGISERPTNVGCTLEDHAHALATALEAVDIQRAGLACDPNDDQPFAAETQLVDAGAAVAPTRNCGHNIILDKGDAFARETARALQGT
ncbi:alpha/beta fold hydrolase [Streptomyces sp. NPDC051453]|uniref:alpha/beta fold hydrolase n=1 Tax=Streptomyces sp. NPDC051453 TaxID=3154941 RepID=UPI0034379355